MTLFKTRHVEVAQESRIRKLHTTRERGALIFIFGHLNNEHLITQHYVVTDRVPEIRVPAMPWKNGDKASR